MPLFTSHGRSGKRRALVVCVRSYRLGQPRTSNGSCRNCNQTIKPISKTAKATETAFLPTKTSLEGCLARKQRHNTLGCVVPADASTTNRTVVGSPLFPYSNQSSRQSRLHDLWICIRTYFALVRKTTTSMYPHATSPLGKNGTIKQTRKKKNTIDYFGGSSHAIRSLSSVLPPPRTHTHKPAARPPLTGFFLSRSPPRAVDVS